MDEKPDEAPMIEVELSEAQMVRKSLLEAQPETKEHLDALLSFMERYSYAAANKLYRPGIEENLSELTQKLGWFKTKEASLVAKSGGSSAENLFAFARALVLGRACVYTNGPLPCFFGYEENRVVDLTAGTVLLDATADIDGVSSIVPWRAATETPKARYDNLEIIHVPQHTRKNLSTYLKKATNQRDYVNWVKATITQYVQSGQKAFVVCKKCLFDNERIPTWPQGDPRFKEPKLYTEKFEWDLEGRKLCATHWGSGIGSNAWMKADVVLLFDEYIPPRRSSVAQTQGLRGHKVYEGDLGGMSTLNSKAPAVDSISEGHVLRWTKQLALRGNARNYDKDGVCGKQRLVVGSNLKRFMANVEMLFPKVKLVRVGNHSDRSTYGEQILAMLSTTRERLLSTKVISNLIGKPWRNVLPFVRTPAFLRSLKTLGWQYKSLRGRGGAQFERLVEVSC